MEFPKIQVTFDDWTLCAIKEYKHNEGVDLYKELLNGEAHISIGLDYVIICRNNGAEWLKLQNGELMEVLN